MNGIEGRHASAPAEIAPLYFPVAEGGAERVRDQVAKVLAEVGMPWAADRAAVLAYLASLWLIRTGGTGPLVLPQPYLDRGGALVVRVGDGSLARAAKANGPLYSMLVSLAGGAQSVEVARTGSGRMLTASFRPRAAFVVRLGLRQAELEDPPYAYEEFGPQDEAQALDAARAALGGMRRGRAVRAVHMLYPQDQESAWRLVDPETGFVAEPDERLLTPEELAELVKDALRACAYDWATWGTRPARDLFELLQAARRPGNVPERALRQVAEKVASRAPASPIRDPLLFLIAYSHGGLADPAVTGPLPALQRLLAVAWDAWEQQVAREFEAQRARGYDPASDPLTYLTLAGCHYLLARDPESGRTQIKREIAALGTAGAVIAECLLTGRLTLLDGQLVNTGVSIPAESMSLAARGLMAMVRSGERLTIAAWLTYLAGTAPGQIEQALLNAGVLQAADPARRRRRGRSDAVAVPADPGLVRRIIGCALYPSKVASLRREEAAVLLALVRATGQDRTEPATWFTADTREVVTSLLDPAGADLAALIENVTAAVTMTVASVLR